LTVGPLSPIPPSTPWELPTDRDVRSTCVQLSENASGGVAGITAARAAIPLIDREDAETHATNLWSVQQCPERAFKPHNQYGSVVETRTVSTAGITWAAEGMCGWMSAK
jgi:hypothetical protein